jgi:serine/threonine kinase 38
VEHVKAERNVLAEVHNPFIVKLYYSFQDEAHLYLLMEYLPGGDVMVRAEWAEGARTVCKCP